MWALLPIKHVSNAKRRLASSLSPDQRDRLCRAMAQDVLTVLCESADIDGTSVLSDDPEVAALADKFGCDYFSEGELGASGLNDVVAAAASRHAQSGIDNLLILHGDLPLLSVKELATLLASHASLGDPAVTIATDRHGTGSNCLIVSPAAGFNYRFGKDSRQLHEQAARDAAMACRVLELPGLSVDVDTPDDIALLRSMLDAESQSRTARCLSQF